MRSTGDAVWVRRSADDGATWAGWAAAGVTTTNAPSAASSAAGRVDLVTRSASGSVVHSWFQGGAAARVDRPRRAASSPSTPPRSATARSTSSRCGRAARACASTGTGRTWGGWVSIGGDFTSGLSASADPAPRGDRRQRPRHQRRDLRAGVHRDRAPPRGGSGGADGLSSWSDRALGDTWPGVARLAVGAASDRRVVVQRGSMVVGHDGGLDLVGRPRLAPGRQLPDGRARRRRRAVGHRRRPHQLRQPLASAGWCAEPGLAAESGPPAAAIHVVDLTSAIRSPSVRMDAGRALADDVGTRPPDGLRRPPRGPFRP